jgi:hypothetical protein
MREGGTKGATASREVEPPKSHDEILALFAELDTLEQQWKDLESRPLPAQDSQQPSPRPDDAVPEPRTPPALRKTRLNDRGKAVRVRRQRSTRPQNSTFTLHLDTDCELRGFDTPRQKPAPLHLRHRKDKPGAAKTEGRFSFLARLHRGESKETAGRLRQRLFARLRRKE